MAKFSNFKLRTKVLMISMTSMIVLGVSLTLVASIFMEKEVVKSLESELKSLAYSVAYSYDSTDGDYKIDSNGVVTKGNMILTDDMEAIDYLYRKSDTYSSFFYGDTRIATSLRDDEGNRLVNEVAMEEVVQTVLIDGEEYFTNNNIINGVSYYSYFIPIRQTDSVEIIGMVGVYYEFDNSGIMNRTMQMTIIYLVLLVVSSIVVVIICNSISKSIKRAIKALNQVSKGDLSIEPSDKYYKRKDEVGDITKAIISLRDSLKEIITHISDTANSLTDSAIKLNETAVQTNKTTEEVASAVEDIAMGATSQAVETQNATNDVISMGEMISITEKDVTNINIESEEMRIISKEAMEILEELNNTNDKTKETIHMIADQTSTTNESAQKIKEATAFISSIADETNLLALNASIEAARAGEHGRGFAVVAAQIQKLAEQSNDTTGMIEQVIAELLTDTNKAVEIMEEVNSIITEQSLNVEKTKKMFGTVNEGIINSIDGVSTISKRMISLNKTKESVIDIVQSLTAIAEQNAASTEETSAAVEELTATMNETSDLASSLSDYAESLKKNVSTFKI